MHQAERDRIYSHLMNFERRLQSIESAQQTRTQEPQPDSDGWIPWHGGECPVDGETKVDVRLHCGAELPAYRAKDLTWWHYKNRPASRIISYRPAKQEAEWPRAGDRYWTIDAGMCVFPFNWDGGPFDKGFQNFLGVYPTREAAEDAAAKIKRVMDHWRNGGSVELRPGGHAEIGQGIKL